MAKYPKFLIVFVLGTLFLQGIGSPKSTSAQSEDCGNGLVQRLGVGLSGRVILGPPHSGNRYFSP